MKKFCKDLRKHATKIINYEKKKMIISKRFVIYVKKNLIKKNI